MSIIKRAEAAWRKEKMRLDDEIATLRQQLAEEREKVAELSDVLIHAADVCDKWAKQSQSGGWSTHQVESNRKTADVLRRAAALYTTEAKTDD